MKGLDAEDRKIVDDNLRTVELGWPIGMLLYRSLSSNKEMWEVLSALPGNREAHVLFCMTEGYRVLDGGADVSSSPRQCTSPRAC